MKKQTILTVLLTLFVAQSSIAQIPASESPEKFVASIEVGPSFLLGKSNLSPWGTKYRDQYKNTFSANVKAQFLIGWQFWLGAKYSNFTKSGNYTLVNSSDIAENISLNYAALQIGRRYTGKRMVLASNLGGGFLHYHNNGLLADSEYTMNAHTFACNLDFDVDFKVFDDLHLGLGLSFMGGNFDKYKLKQNSQKTTVKLNKWNELKVLSTSVTLGVKYAF